MSISVEIPAKVADMSSTLSLLFCHPNTTQKELMGNEKSKSIHNPIKQQTCKLLPTCTHPQNLTASVEDQEAD
jgi:hypothetical protein